MAEVPKGRVYGRARGRWNDQRQYHSDYRTYRSKVQCHHCKKFWYIKAHCWLRDKSMDKSATLAAEEKEVSNLFVAQHESSEACNIV